MVDAAMVGGSQTVTIRTQSVARLVNEHVDSLPACGAYLHCADLLLDQPRRRGVAIGG